MRRVRTHDFTVCTLIKPNYSHLSNSRGGWNKRGGVAKVAKSINVETNYYITAINEEWRVERI